MVFLFSFIIMTMYGQADNSKVLEILKKSTASLESSSTVSMTSNYKLYAGHNSKILVEEYSGLVLKKESTTYFKIGNTEFVSFGKNSMKISHDQKAIAMDYNNKTEVSPLSLGSYMKGFSTKLIEDPTFYICELKPASISQFMFSKVLLYISKKDYSIAKQVLFFVEQAQRTDTNDTLVTYLPRLEIVFKPRPTSVSDGNRLRRETYYSEVNKKVVLSERLATYRLFQSY